MARTKQEKNGRLEEALATLLQNQAALVQNQTSFVTQLRERDREMTELQRINSERFARIEAILLDHSRILAEHGRILERLPDAVRDKIGFKAPP
jgi:serine phosphatase RsbU (regulator of sigma subunit)